MITLAAGGWAAGIAMTGLRMMKAIGSTKHFVSSVTPKKAAGILLFLFLLAFSHRSEAQAVAVISNQVVTLAGVPVPYANVRICPYTASGVPCTPLATIYSDPALTHQIPNPTTADQNGFFSVFVASGVDFYIIQEIPVPGTNYIYYANGNNGGSSGVGCSPPNNSVANGCTGAVSFTPNSLIGSGATPISPLVTITALPQGVIAVTQPNGDSSAKVATDAFVQATSGYGCLNGNAVANGCTGGISQLTDAGSLGIPGPEINVAKYGAVGDCTGNGSTASCTDNCTPLTNAFNAAFAAGVSVYFPINVLSTGPTVYYTSCSINPQGVSFYAPIGSAGQSQGSVSQMLVSVRGAPGKDVFDVPNPGATAPVLLSKGFVVSNIGFNVDATVDASSSGTNSFPNRLPGRTCFDAVANGTTVVTSALQCQFQPGDVGQAILINTVTTTIASWQSANQVTLNATVTAGTGLTAYVSVDGLSATQTAGNCGFAMDASGLAGGYGSGPLKAEFNNVVIQFNGSQTNNTCGYFFQGNTSPYQSKWDHGFVRGEFPFLFAMANTAASLGGGSQVSQGIADLNEFDDMWVEGTYPWISYGGNYDTIKNMYVDGAYGPSILTGNGFASASDSNTPTGWNIDIPEIETTSPCPSGATTFRISGRDHVVDRLSTFSCSTGSLPTFQWDAGHSTVAVLTLPSLGNLAITGNLNTFRSPFYVTATPAAYSITGIGNTFETCTDSNPAYGVDPGRCQYAGLGSSVGPPQLSRGSIVFNRTHDFIDKGATAYYLNGEDLWYWPDEVQNNDSAVTVVQDSTSVTGQAISIAGTNSYTLDGADGLGLTYGNQVPASKLRFYVMAKANTSLSWAANLGSSYGGYTTLCSFSPTLTTSYAVYECDGDATAYSGTIVYFSLGAAGSGNTVSIAWIGIRPWYSDLEVNGPVNATSYQVSGSALATGNLADWTNASIANGDIPLWNSGTSKWTASVPSTSILSDWTDSGVVNGNVPVWNSTTSKWTPGSGGNSVSGGTLGSVPYQTGPGVTGVTLANTSTSTLCLTETGTGSAGAEPTWGSCAGSAATAFSAITTSTNNSATMQVGSGAILEPTASTPGEVIANYEYNCATAGLATTTSGGALGCSSSVTGITIDGVTPTTMGYVDATSSIQTQLNAKLSSIGWSVPAVMSVSPNPITSNGTVTLSFNNQTANTSFMGPATGSAATPTFRVFVNADFPNTLAPTILVTNMTGTGAFNITGTAAGLSGTPALPNGTTATTQTTGDATTKISTDAFVAAALVANPVSINGTSCALGGSCSPELPVIVVTSSTVTLGGTYNSGVAYNENATASQAVTATLPAPAAGKIFCIKNFYNGSAANTGTLELLVANTGTQFIVFNGTLSASGYVISTGASGDYGCVVGVDSTHWDFNPSVGSWVLH